MEVRLKAGAWVDPARMIDTIHRAGYTPMPEDVRLTLEGKLTGEPEKPVVSLEDVKPPVALPLVADEKDPAPLAQAVEQLRQGAGSPAHIEGRWRPAGKASPAPAGVLAVTRVAVGAPALPGSK